MQIRSDFTNEELMNTSDPLALACFPLNKIGLLSEMFGVMHLNPDSTENMFERENLYTLHSTLEDAKREIEHIIDISNKQWRRDLKEYPRLKGRQTGLEQFLAKLARQMEEEPDDWDFKATAESIRYQLDK